MRRRRPVDSDRRLVARAALRTGGVAAGLVAVVVVALSAVLGVLVVHQQVRDDRALVQRTLDDATFPDPPPPDTYLTVVTDGRSTSTPGLPAGLPDTAAIVAAVGGRSSSRTVHLGDRHLLVETRPRDGGAVQVAYDLHHEDELRDTVVVTALVVGSVGLLAAAAVAGVVARRSVRPLSDALALQRAFVADASHELRTPLTLLTTRAQVLRMSVEADGSTESAADAAGLVADAERLTEVVDDLLLAADTRADPDRAPTDLTALAHEVAATAGPYAAKRGIALVVRGEAVVCPANPTAVRRAVVALVDNAIQHAAAGGEVTVETRAEPRRRGRGWASVAVTDDGPGVDPAVVADLFRRFRSGGQSASRRGYGLGLALVRDVAVRHGGRVRLAESGGRGACFVLELPLS